MLLPRLPFQPYSHESAPEHLPYRRDAFAAPDPLRGPGETQLTIIICLAPGKLTPKHQLYDASLDGAWLLTHRDPEPTVCRELAKRGFSGRVEFRWGDRPGLIVNDLHAFAKKATRENARQGPLMVAYKPHAFMLRDFHDPMGDAHSAAPLTSAV